MPAHAALTPLVQCGSEDFKNPCQLCDILSTFKRIIDFTSFIFVPILAGLLFLISGFMILIGGASPEMIGKGREMFKLTVIGVVVIYSSWLIANTVIQTLAGDNKAAGSWFKLECKEAEKFVGPPGSGGGGTLPGGGTGGLTHTQAKEQLDQAQVPIKPGASLEGVRQDAIDAVKYVNSNCNCSVVVTSGSDSEHSQVGGHYQGYSVDVRTNTGLTNYVTQNFQRISDSPGGFPRYSESATGATWMNEGDHWHVDSRG